MQLPKIKKSVKEFLKCEEGNISKKSLLSIVPFILMATTTSASSAHKVFYPPPGHYFRYVGDEGTLCSYGDRTDECLPSVNVPTIKCDEPGSNCEIKVRECVDRHCSHVGGSETHGETGYKADMVLISGGEVIPIKDVECGRGHISYEHNVRVDCGVGKYQRISKHINELSMIEDLSTGNMKLTAKHYHNMEEKKYLVWARFDGAQLKDKGLDCHCNES